MRAAKLCEEDGCWVQDVPIKDYYSVQECSIILDVGSPSIYSAIKRGTMKGVRVNGVTHVRHADLIAYINKRGTGRPMTSLADAVIEEINPEDDSERQEVVLPDGSGDEDEDEDGEATVETRESPLDFLNE